MHGCKVQSAPTTTVSCISSLHAYSYIQQSGRSVNTMNAKNTRKKSPIHENADANITCDFGDGDISRCRSLLPASHIVSSIIVRLHTYVATLLRLRNRALVVHIYHYIGCSKRRATCPPGILVAATCVAIYCIFGHCSCAHIFTLAIDAVTWNRYAPKLAQHYSVMHTLPHSSAI